MTLTPNDRNDTHRAHGVTDAPVPAESRSRQSCHRVGAQYSYWMAALPDAAADTYGGPLVTVAENR